MAFSKMFWITDKSTFKIKVKTKIRNAVSAPLQVKVKTKIRNAVSAPLSVTVRTSIRNYYP